MGDFHRTHHLRLDIHLDPYRDQNGQMIGTCTTTVTGSGNGLDFALAELIDAMPDDTYRALMDALEATSRGI